MLGKINILANYCQSFEVKERSETTPVQIETPQIRALKKIAAIIDRCMIKPESGHYPQGPCGNVFIGPIELVELSEALNDGLNAQNNKFVEELASGLNEIDGLTDFLDISEDIAPNLHPSYSYIALQIRKKAKSLRDMLGCHFMDKKESALEPTSVETDESSSSETIQNDGLKPRYEANDEL